MIDITKALFDSIKQITNNKVVKADQFELLEGTRALEVLNPRLDTGLINLDPEDYHFDCARPQSPIVIINIQMKLLKSLVHWLTNESLPVTVLSCRYVQTLLENYLTKQTSIWEQCSFYQPRFEHQEQYNHDDVEYSLVHKVLKVFIMGLCRFIGFVLEIAKTFLYEEEDITTRKMSLNFLDSVNPQFLIDEINDVIEWIIIHEVEYSDVIITQLKVIISLLKIESSIAGAQIQFLEEDNNYKVDVSLYSQAISQLEKLESFAFDESKIPKAAFSKFIQVDMENKNIPLELPNLDLNIAFNHLKGIFTTVSTFMQQANSITSINQLQDYLDYNIKYPIDTFSVFSRGLFQHFFIRDDKSIFGSSKMDVGELCIELVENLVGKNTIILNNFESQLSQIKDSIKVSIIERYNQARQDLEAGIYHNLSTYGSNPCRHQQLLSKGLLLWDTLQVTWESLEVDMFHGYHIGDEFAGGRGEVAITVTSYIYYTKIKMMTELLLNGFELQLYKPFETYLIFWYGDYLVQNLIEHLDNRLTKIIIGKIEHLETVIPKKIKKLKTGTKKDQLKQLNKYNHEVILPQLTATLNYNQDYLVKSYQSLQVLLKSHMTFLAALSKLGLFDFTKGPTNSLTSMESLYYLRLKPWSSIGVPNFPTYQQFSPLAQATKPESTNRANLFKCLELLALVKNSLAESKNGFGEVVRYIKRNPKSFIDQSKIEEWYQGYLNAIDEFENTIATVSKLISGNKEDLTSIKQNYKVDIEKGCHRYIPRFSIVHK